MTMPGPVVFLTIFAFIMTMLLIFWRPRDLNEAIAATSGALLVLLCGSVSLSDLGMITSTVSGAAITILATIVMANVLESFGFFHWTAHYLLLKAKGSGIRLFWIVNLLCFLMTLLFNNDGSILITTPILLMLLKRIGLKPRQQIPYLLSGALIATASSAPIGVSNIVNLIALKIIGLDLYMQTALMFVPSMLGLIVLVLLLFIYFYKDLPKSFPAVPFDTLPVATRTHPLQSPPPPSNQPRSSFIRNVLLFVLGVRASLFIASFIGIPVSVAAVFGSLVLLVWRWWKLKIPPVDMLKKTPWHIFVFAYAMYIIIYGLHNIGLTDMLIAFIHPLVSSSLLHASLLMGSLVTLMSNLFNNHPALMIGTLTLTNMHLDPTNLKIAYLANVIGSDVGSLILPIGTLATLIWMTILRRNKVKISWMEYIKCTSLVIPPALFFTLFCLYFWVTLFF
jgi:arsenical pump membrane protein